MVEAVQYNGDFIYSNGEPYLPEWAMKAFEDGTMYFKEAGKLYIKTVVGHLLVSAGDYIVMDNDGFICPCDPDIFEQTYKEMTVPTGPTGPLGLYGGGCPLCGGHELKWNPDNDVTSCPQCGWANWKDARENYRKRVKNGEIKLRNGVIKAWLRERL